MAAAYPDAHHELRVILERVPQCFKWGLFDREPLARWTEGRVTLLGDAAHSMLPFLGQGAAMGFEDAYVLACELARSSGEVQAALISYECERRPRTAQVQLASRVQGERYHLHSPLARLRRRLGIDRAEQKDVNLLSKDWILDYDPTMPDSATRQRAATVVAPSQLEFT